MVERDTLFTSIVLVVERDTLFVLIAGGGKGYPL
jgi:hypothetical protein